MATGSSAEKLLVESVRCGDEEAWQKLIAHFEGRLLAFFRPRVRDRSIAEDLVQETFLGLLTSLGHFDADRPLEQYLFSIAAHKLTDYLRRVRSRPDLLPADHAPQGTLADFAGRDRRASSIFQSRERKSWEEKVLVQALKGLVDYYKTKGYWQKLSCVELLMLRGWPNKRVAEALGISEQAVANIKFEFIEKLREAVRAVGVCPELFPELMLGQNP
ncbi:MAG: sigma-70 family RNA polymerase sigma factor [Thermoguttaceae bacterium]|nr:sigma-70 family RNA polymerase sigma factor [Thermoguttaceae bacterium]MDW8079842.1 sigma-70 family RNA polymerase sigma factor [Thermoguttaceae bacterium]